MKQIIIRAVVFLVLIISVYLILKTFIKREYKYIDIEGNWGISNNCYRDKRDRLYCHTEHGIWEVEQYYWED